MYVVQKNHVRNLSKNDFENLRLCCKLSKNLYNVTLWTTRKYHEENNKFLPYESAYHIVKKNENYVKIPSAVGQQTMKVVDRSFKSFFNILKQKKAGNYNRPVRIPHYLRKDGYFVCIFQQSSFKVVEKNGKTLMRLSMGLWFQKEQNCKYLFFAMPLNVIGHQIKEVRIIPRYGGIFFEIEYVYNQDPIPTDLDTTKYVGIDLGLQNFATCYSTLGTSFICEGQGIKAYNQLWNKRKAKLQSQYDRQNIKFGSKMNCLLWQRSQKINNFMAQNVNYIIQHCLQHKIGNIVVGELKDIKQNANLGKKNNQHFQYITNGLFKQKLQSKCEIYGIKYIETEESYTSQTCSQCGRIRKANRKHRGLYVCDQCHAKINADTNGAINIIKKVAPKAFGGGSSGIVNVPVRVRLAV